MKAKSVVSAVLLLFVAASVVYLIASESRPPREPDRSGSTAITVQAERTRVEVEPTEVSVASAKAPEEPAGHRQTLIVYYFHRTQRCRTCLAMEAYAQQALTDGFPEALESGELEWRAVNIEEPQNEHFIQEYGLTASALVMVLLENGEQKRSKDLSRIWDLVGDESAFKEYVRSEASAQLESGS